VRKKTRSRFWCFELLQQNRLRMKHSASQMPRGTAYEYGAEAQVIRRHQLDSKTNGLLLLTSADSFPMESLELRSVVLLRAIEIVVVNITATQHDPRYLSSRGSSGQPMRARQQ